tara:strand:- start:681 stop:1577 length:897 start_codon:yes stop_codon:yes gene_type:complete
MKKFDVKQDVVNRIIEKFETVGKFEMPFKTFGTQNFQTNIKYRGINILLLAMAGYSSPYWGTWNQWFTAGGGIKEKVNGKWKITKPSKYNVQAGEKSTQIVFWNTKKIEDKETGEEKTVAWAKYYNVFNSEQVTGWEAPAEDLKDETQIISEADAFFNNIGVNTKETSGGCASYRPSTDSISMPTRKDFNATKTSSATETYYATLAHENIHATMHESRCDRNMKSYAAEELVAEIGAAMLCEQLGISSEMRDDHVAYIKGWLEALRNDKQFIFTAATKSQEAVDWMNEQQEVSLKKVA